HPGSREDADGVRVIATTCACPGVDGGSPGRAVARVIGETRQGLTQALVAGESKRDASVLSGGVRDGRDASLRGELVIAREASALVAQLGQDLGSVDAACSRQRGDDGTVRMCADSVLDGGRDPCQLRHERFKHADEGTDELALGLALRLATQSGGSAAQTLEECRGGATGAVAILRRD